MTIYASDNQIRIQAVVENMINGLMTIDERGTVESYNKACERMFGYKADELLGAISTC